MKITGLLALALFVAPAGAQTRYDAEAVRLNNRGVAEMSQQMTERAAPLLPRHSRRIQGWRRRPSTRALRCWRCKSWTRQRRLLQQAHCARPGERSGMVQPGPGRSTRPMNWSRRLASFQQAVKLDPAGCGFLLLRGRLLSGVEGLRQGDCGIPEGADDRSAARLGGVCRWRALCNAREDGRGQGSLQALSAFDQHQDRRADGARRTASRATTRPWRQLRSMRRETSR